MTSVTHETLLLRQVNPKFLNKNQLSIQAFLTSQVFEPFSKDNGLLSVHNNGLISAKEAADLYEYDTCGVVAVTDGECKATDLQTRPDPIGEGLLERAHHIIDYTPFNKSQQKKKASLLKKYAELRGFLYQCMKVAETHA